MANKFERRQNYSEVNMKSTERFGLLCSPYQALQLLVNAMLQTIITDFNRQTYIYNIFNSSV